MGIDVIALLPSVALREAIRAQNHAFSEGETLIILYRYAKSFDERLALLSDFAATASDEYADTARRIADWERDMLARFAAPAEGFIYETNICEPQDTFGGESSYWATYEAAVAAVPAYYARYAHVGAKPTDPNVHTIRKLPIGRQGAPWPDAFPDRCLVDAKGRVLDVGDDSRYPLCPEGKDCNACTACCLWEDVLYPSFIKEGHLVRYTVDHYPHAAVKYGLCPDDFGGGPCSYVYLYPLSSDAVRYGLVSDEACLVAHEHMDAPLCEPISPEELPEDLRAPAAAFWALYNERNEQT